MDRYNNEATMSEPGDPAHKGLNTKTHEQLWELIGKDVSRMLLTLPSFLWATNCHASSVVEDAPIPQLLSLLSPLDTCLNVSIPQ